MICFFRNDIINQVNNQGVISRIFSPNFSYICVVLVKYNTWPLIKRKLSVVLFGDCFIMILMLCD